MQDDEYHQNWIIYFFIILVVGGVVFWFLFRDSNKPEYFSDEEISSYTTAKRNHWDLSIYSSETPDTDYQIDTIRGFATRGACVEEGLKRSRETGSFECSYKCKTQYLQIKDSNEQFEICERVCDEAGCRD